MTVALVLRTGLTLLGALLAAWLCEWLHTPIPWMLGPLLLTALASMAGAPTRSSGRLRNIGQWVIGAALGLYFTPQVGALVLKLWWAIALGIAWALAIGWGFGLWLQRRHCSDLASLGAQRLRATSYFAGAIGGASEMTLLSDRVGARTDLVAAAHSLRLVMVVISVPFAMQWAQGHWGLQVDPSLRSIGRPAEWPGLLWLAGITLAVMAISAMPPGEVPRIIVAGCCSTPMAMSQPNKAETPSMTAVPMATEASQRGAVLRNSR